MFAETIIFVIGGGLLLLAGRALWMLAQPTRVQSNADNNWQNARFADFERQIGKRAPGDGAVVKGRVSEMNNGSLVTFGGGALIVVVCTALVGCPRYNVYSQEMAGRAKLAEAQSSRQVAILEAHAKMESAKELAQAEVIRAQGAAKANHILQDSLGGPEGYLRYLQIQAYENTNAKVIYVPTEGGLPLTEAGRLPERAQ